MLISVCHHSNWWLCSFLLPLYFFRKSSDCLSGNLPVTSIVGHQLHCSVYGSLSLHCTLKVSSYNMKYQAKSWLLKVIICWKLLFCHVFGYGFVQHWTLSRRAVLGYKELGRRDFQPQTGCFKATCNRLPHFHDIHFPEIIYPVYLFSLWTHAFSFPSVC